MNRAVFTFLALVCLSSCGLFVGGDSKTDFVGSPTKPEINSGGDPWGDEDEEDGPEPHPNGNPPGRLPSDTVLAAKFCMLDGKTGSPISNDEVSLNSGPAFLQVHGIGGGCIQRPIREVWAVTLNHEAIKDDLIGTYRPTLRADLVEPQKNIFFVFDIESVATIFRISWNTQWFHTVTEGTLEYPRKISIQGEKTSGSALINIQKEEYYLEEISPTVTGFVMEQTLRAPFCTQKRVRQNIESIRKKLREDSPEWSQLNSPQPAAPGVQ